MAYKNMSAANNINFPSEKLETSISRFIDWLDKFGYESYDQFD